MLAKGNVRAFSFEEDAFLVQAIAKPSIPKMLRAEGIRFGMDYLGKCSVRVTGRVPLGQIKMRSGNSCTSRCELTFSCEAVEKWLHISPPVLRRWSSSAEPFASIVICCARCLLRGTG